MIYNDIELAIIGGTGIGDPALMKTLDSVKVDTPFGAPSDAITIAEYQGKRIAFLSRHGAKHEIPPHKVNYRANIWALKKLGVKRLLVSCACGSLQENYKPGELVILDQFIDFTKKRECTFFDGGEVCHVSTADPFCKELRALASNTAKEIGLNIHQTGTLVCIDGPRFSTRAESIFFKETLQAHVVGMTTVPECVLAREAEICYLAIGAVTDFDCWKDEPVSAAMVEACMKSNAELLQKLFGALVPKIPAARKHCECPTALHGAGHTIKTTRHCASS